MRIDFDNLKMIAEDLGKEHLDDDDFESYLEDLIREDLEG